jgi:hypothetical protein
MSAYRIRESGEIKSQGEIRAMNRNTSFPKVWGQNVHEAIGIDPVLITPKPESAEAYKHYTRNGVEQDANGNWVQAWTEADMFSKYTDGEGVVHTKAQQETAYQADLDAAAAKSVRANRDTKLADTDWTGMSDVTMSAEMATYRQALRDITALENFPSLETDDWPTAP